MANGLAHVRQVGDQGRKGSKDRAIAMHFWLPSMILALAACAPAIANDAQTGLLPFAQTILDANADGRSDYIVVITLPDGDRLIALEEGAPQGGRTLVAAIKLGGNATGFGDIAVGPAGGFSIFAGCDTCARDSYVTEFKITYTDGRYVLSGFATTHADRSTASVSICDVDLLTGTATITRDDTQFKVPSADRSIPLAGITSDFMPDVCRTLATADTKAR